MDNSEFLDRVVDQVWIHLEGIKSRDAKQVNVYFTDGRVIHVTKDKIVEFIPEG